MTFDISGIDVALANSFRRILLSEVCISINATYQAPKAAGPASIAGRCRRSCIPPPPPPPRSGLGAVPF